MITTTPVARWTWGHDHDGGVDTVDLCLRDLLGAYRALVSHHLVVDSTIIHIRVPEAGKPKHLLFDGSFTVNVSEPQQVIASRLAGQVRSSRHVGIPGSVDGTIDCTGIIKNPGQDVIQPELFRLSTHAYRDYITTSLVTYSDIWMQYDLKGRAQPDIHAANQPSLAAALTELSEVLDSETEPDDPTYFGTPTESGVDNYFEPDGSPSDVWSRFEL
ncbi:hypothetical protein [Nocardia niigatensis]|uniref:hypothetical protein n=1 Tax=Nocardia niigatensis TaxID=209249 RepID=UPI0012F64E89|nr:hypothetical protein [Nocardia niigatensis]